VKNKRFKNLLTEHIKITRL